MSVQQYTNNGILENPIERDYDSGKKILLPSSPTVVSSAPAVERDDAGYQSESDMEKDLLHRLDAEGIKFEESINDEDSLIANMRLQLESLNGFSFTDDEWVRFVKECISTTPGDVLRKTKLMQQEHVVSFKTDDGECVNIRLVDDVNPMRNTLQVIHQYRAESGKRRNRYDVTILMNGIPSVQIELKRRGVPIREAFNQIDRYQSESFSSGMGLFDFVQIFVISNGTDTRYYPNTVRLDKTSNSRSRRNGSFKGTNHWSDSSNNIIKDITAFAETFLSPVSLKMILTRYCVLMKNGRFVVMRPYQICAVEKSLERVKAVINSGDWDKLAGGFIWHATGSGKTLTAFKLSQVIADYCDGIDKMVFIVDRKDLDYQTTREFNKFQEGSVNATINTLTLARQLESDSVEDRIIVTTIQKYASYIKGKRLNRDVMGKRYAFVFDECHRSQCGTMHKLIEDKFKNSIMFGFTGTPIFTENAQSSGDPTRRTTEQLFGSLLHRYTVSNAIDDKNVLPFRFDFIGTIAEKPNGKKSSEKVQGIDTASVLNNPERIRNNSRYIINHFDQKTMRKKRIVSDNGMTARNGFSAMLACQSISMAKTYYTVLKQMCKNANKKLNIGIIYSDTPNKGYDDGSFIDDEDIDSSLMNKSDRDFMQMAIDDYNEMFATTYSLDGDGFDNYYKDVSRRLRGDGDNGSFMPQEETLDLLIVVNMFLTGFDAKLLNTMFLDKQLKQHGLIQAISRTNRTINDLKSYGNIISFQTTEDIVNDAFNTFGDERANGKVLLKPYEEYLQDYISKTQKLINDYPIDSPLVGERAKREFINLFSNILRLLNILESFDEFSSFAVSVDNPLNARMFQDYKGRYLDLHADMRQSSDGEKESIVDDVVFETELIKSIDINVDYILNLVEERRRKNGNLGDEFIDSTLRQVRASSALRDKCDLINEFLHRITNSVIDQSVDEGNGEQERDAWLHTLSDSMDRELADIIESCYLDRNGTIALMSEAFSKHSGISDDGTGITKLLVGNFSRFGSGGDKKTEAKKRAYTALKAFYDKYGNVTSEYPISIS